MQEIDNIPNNEGLENAPMLSKLQDQNNISIPDGYFDSLENDIMAQIKPSVSIAPKPKIGFKKVLYYAAAASVIAVLSIIAIRMNDGKPNDDILVNDDIIENTSTPDVKNIVDNFTTDKAVNNTNKEEININNQEPKEIESIAIENNDIELPNQSPQNNKPNTPINIIENDDYEEEVVIANNDFGGGSNIINPISSGGMSSSASVQTHTDAIASVARLGSHEGNLYLSKDTCINSDFIIDIPNDTLSVVWNDNSKNKIYNITESGKYWAEYYYKGNKIYTDTINVKIIPLPEINISDVEVCNHQSVLLNSGISEEVYTHEWSISKSSNSEILLDNLDPGIQEVNLKVSSCCDTVITTIALNVQDCNIKIPNVITPNGDGYNDAFVITGIENYPKTSVNIFDRNGKLIYQSLDYKNDWRAENVASGNYFYSVIINDGNQTEKGGVLKIMR